MISPLEEKTPKFRISSKKNLSNINRNLNFTIEITNLEGCEKPRLRKTADIANQIQNFEVDELESEGYIYLKIG